MKHIFQIFVSSTAILVLYLQSDAMGGAYLNSAHGNSTYGVKRSSTTTFAKGNCAHCHEQHSSIDGSEPAPTGGPSGGLLFYDNHIDQTDGFCFKCHTGVSSLQTGGIVNRSYSYRAGGWTDDTLDNVKDAFSLSSSHNLTDVRTFISDGAQAPWNYRSDSNPCLACHDPHAAQGDPANAGSTTKSSTSRGWMLSRPSQHGNSPWGLWGDESTEKMSNYTNLYKAPYRLGGAGSAYEPDGSATTDGSNLADFNTFCMDCHNSTNTINSTTLGRPLRTIDWSATGDRHGKATGTPPSAKLSQPYTNNTSYVLACTDCHEPHGSPNIFLIRSEVNGNLNLPTLPTTLTRVTVTGAAQNASGFEWASLCERCHGNASAIDASHQGLGWACIDCHNGSNTVYSSCITCHAHGKTAAEGGL